MKKEHWHIVPVGDGFNVVCRNLQGEHYHCRKEVMSHDKYVLEFNSQEQAQKYINDNLTVNNYKPEKFWRLG